MAKTILKDIKLLVSKFDLSSQINNIEMALNVEEKDVTTFDTTGDREFLGGLRDSKWTYQGFWDAAVTTGDPDATLFAGLGTALPATAIKPAAAGAPAVGDVLYMISGASLAHKFGGAVGDVAPMTLDLRSAAAMVRGLLLDRQAAATATGNGTAQQHSAVSATQRLFYVVHVIGGTAGTLDLVIESDNGAGFATAATVATIAQFTGPGSVWGYVNGAITDDYFRVARTIAGGGTWNYYVGLGIITL